MQEMRLGTHATLPLLGSTNVSPDAFVKLSVEGILREAAVTFEERGAMYGHNYKDPFSLVMQGLQAAAQFDPKHMTPPDWSRLGLLVQIAYKITRYCQMFDRGGHVDSAHDMCVYAAMLEEITIP